MHIHMQSKGIEAATFVWQAIYICFPFSRFGGSERWSKAEGNTANSLCRSSTTSKITKLKLDGIRDEHKRYKCTNVYLSA